jgi:hypothetical protein
MALKLLPRNMLALVFTEDGFTTQVITRFIVGLEIDEVKREWGWNDSGVSLQKTGMLSIGEMDKTSKLRRRGVIGVYFSNNQSHCLNMFMHAKEVMPPLQFPVASSTMMVITSEGRKK